MDSDERLLAVADALGDDSEEGMIWAANIIRYANNTLGSFEYRLVPYPEEDVRRAWRVALGIRDEGFGSSGSSSSTVRPTGPARDAALPSE